MSTCGSTPAASACATWARPISPPSRVTKLLSAMFCALNGATRYARLGQQAAEGRGDQALADVAGGPEDHERAAAGHVVAASCRFAS